MWIFDGYGRFNRVSQCDFVGVGIGSGVKAPVSFLWSAKDFLQARQRWAGHPPAYNVQIGSTRF
jgi:hypothetical protein